MAVALFRSGPVSRFGSPAVGVFRPALIAGLGAVGIARPRPVGRFRAPPGGVFGPAPVSRSSFMAVAVFRPVLVSLPGIVAVAVLATRAIVVADRAVPVARVTGVTGFWARPVARVTGVTGFWARPVARVTGVTGLWPRPVPRFRDPAVTVRSGPVRFVCLRPVPFVPPVPRFRDPVVTVRSGPVRFVCLRPVPFVPRVPRAWLALVALSRFRPIVLIWPAPVVASRPVPGLGPMGPRPVPVPRILATWIRRFCIRGAGVWSRPWPGTCPATRRFRSCPGRPRSNSGWPRSNSGRPRPGPGRPRPGPGRPRPGPGHPGLSPRHSRRNSPASRVSGPVRVRRPSRAVGTALVSGSAARVSGRTRGPRGPGRRAGTLVARVVNRAGCPLRARDPGGDSRRRSRPRFGPFRVRPVRIRPHLAQRDPVAWGAPVAPGAAVTPRNAVTPQEARAFPLPLMVLVRPGTAPLLVAFPVRAAGRGLVVFVLVLGLMARMPAPVVCRKAIYPVPITVGCGVTTFHRAPPGHSDSDAPAHCGIHPEKSLGRAEYPISAECTS